MDSLQATITHWFPQAEATIDPVVRLGFSGASVWCVECGGQHYALRQWPRSLGSPCQLGKSFPLQIHLADDGLPVPRPILTSTGAELVYCSADRQSWALSTWMPGAADYWQAPTEAKLRAALETLAQLHISAARMPAEDEKHQLRTAPSPALRKRSQLLNDFITADFYQLETALRRHPLSNESTLARETLSHIASAAPAQFEASRRWRQVELPLHWCLRDVWHDHVLFTGDQITGVIDFDAAAIDSPAGDVARLLGSLVGDDPAGWQLGLGAYEAVRPLSLLEQEAVSYFDSSGVVLSALNWLNWLYRDPSVLAESVDRTAAVQRLQRLTARLGVLAATSRS